METNQCPASGFSLLLILQTFARFFKTYWVVKLARYRPANYSIQSC